VSREFNCIAFTRIGRIFFYTKNLFRPKIDFSNPKYYFLRLTLKPTEFQIQPGTNQLSVVYILTAKLLKIYLK